VTTIAPPPPAPTPPPPLSPGGRTALRVAIVGAAALLVIGTVVALSVVSWGASTFRVVTDSQTLPAQLRTLTIDTGDVPIAVRVTTDRDAREPRVDLRMVRSTRSGDHRLTVTDDRAAARISIAGVSTSFMQWGRAGELVVTLPPETARRLSLTTNQKTGVLMAQADLDELIARTTHGPIMLSGAARRIDASSRFGGIFTREPISVSESFRADTVDGEVTVAFKDSPPATVEASSRHGDVDIDLPGSGPYLVRAQSGGSTSVRVPETSDPADAVTEVTARSDDGDVVIESDR
jgi:hypothetical protein